LKALAHGRGQNSPSGEGKPTIEVVHGCVREATKPTLDGSVYEQIKVDIFDSLITPGQRYSEHELSNRFGVYRTPFDSHSKPLPAKCARTGSADMQVSM
jgi:hypothetical protein